MSPPEKLEHYELLKAADGSHVELGHGAMGVTYKAFDTNLQCHVALKVISAPYLNDMGRFTPGAGSPLATTTQVP